MQTELETAVPAVKPKKKITLVELVDRFIKGGKPVRLGYHRITEDGRKLIYKINNPRSTYDGAENVIAIRLTQDGKDFILGNSSILEYIGMYYTWGSPHFNRNETDAQRILRDSQIPMVPFKAFAEAGLDVTQTAIIDRGPDETVKRNEEVWLEGKNGRSGRYVTKRVPVHFTGASLYDVAGKLFLFDIDREEINHGIFNPFIVELPKPVKTIAEAYDSLIPAEVQAAFKRKLKVQRQGEWFFIPVKGKHKPDMRYVERWDREFRDSIKGKQKQKPRGLTLRAGPNRPNEAELGVEKKMLAKGKISHSGREHRDIVLASWHKAVPNTAVKSFTITGDVD